jgi:hypothetical protein
MRTTVTIEPDVAKKLKERMHRDQSTFKATLNDALRRGLGQESPEPSKREVKVEPFDCGFRPGVDTHKLNQLVDELEIDDFVAQHS